MTFAMGPALLFCPGDRPDRFAKAADRADAVILDLEDAVAPDAKAAAREAVATAALDPARTIVRVNAIGEGMLAADLDAVRRAGITTVMLAKTESAAELDALDGFDVVALCETAAGVVHAADIAAHPSVVALMWGAEDLVASIGGTSSRDATGAYRAVATHARSHVLLAAAAHGRRAIDAIRTDIADVDGCRVEAVDAAASGFAAKAAIHPAHVAPIREAFAPTADEAAWAERVLAAAETQPGAFRFEGAMVDEPILRHARSVRARAAAASDPLPTPQDSTTTAVPRAPEEAP
ncbi:MULTISPECIES: HpcH/HpaI aldolase/citrate lyase family protein [unclassified Agrococcus]|uniref:HpcH/HpaI aldolase/citrate lyase family protein n=1 Tax=unclassified Agrococcus TaxID=2615065 RepID=UPI003609BC82